jgi:hypothetical protein
MLLKILAIAMLMGPVAYGQSLGDIARENREKQAAEDASAAKPRVITNANLPKDPDANQPSQEQGSQEQGSQEQASQEQGSHEATPPASSKPAGNRPADRSSANRSAEDRRFAEKRMAEQRAADQWKRQILAQKTKVATLQQHIDRFKASIRFVDASAYPNAAPYNRDQARQLERVGQMQEQLDVEQNKLAEMQETARRAGMHTAVYDP